MTLNHDLFYAFQQTSINNILETMLHNLIVYLTCMSRLLTLLPISLVIYDFKFDKDAVTKAITSMYITTLFNYFLLTYIICTICLHLNKFLHS